jgi:hypothetical protein
VLWRDHYGDDALPARALEKHQQSLLRYADTLAAWVNNPPPGSPLFLPLLLSPQRLAAFAVVWRRRCEISIKGRRRAVVYPSTTCVSGKGRRCKSVMLLTKQGNVCDRDRLFGGKEGDVCHLWREKL